ncbi:hypothetical protein E2C01_008275 [Portunus trituberculatus]|uniref:Uncharacterized protein n=1 Tax=Portunus trituberculatus TaxID=210409 RepID=A0A5B7D5A3_PORTR|nr:hypothetical protein [Portunus trituberculatus]
MTSSYDAQDTAPCGVWLTSAGLRNSLGAVRADGGLSATLPRNSPLLPAFSALTSPRGLTLPREEATATQ